MPPEASVPIAETISCKVTSLDRAIKQEWFTRGLFMAMRLAVIYYSFWTDFIYNFYCAGVYRFWTASLRGIMPLYLLRNLPGYHIFIGSISSSSSFFRQVFQKYDKSLETRFQFSSVKSKYHLFVVQQRCRRH